MCLSVRAVPTGTVDFSTITFSFYLHVIPIVWTTEKNAVISVSMPMDKLWSVSVFFFLGGVLTQIKMTSASATAISTSEVNRKLPY
jgi:hypothetical protein